MAEGVGTTGRRGRRRAVLAIGLVALAWVTVMQPLGWAQTSYYALGKALADGTAQIDRYHWETRDKAWTDGHFFSVKAPGMPVLTLPLYLALEAAGGREASRDVARAARESGDSRWAYKGLLTHAYGYDTGRAARVRAEVEGSAPMIWALTLLGALLPAVALLSLVRWGAERLVPGTGTAVAVVLGTGTLVMTFATNYFGHVLAALLAFAAFALLWRERDGPPRAAWVAVAGVLAGLAVVVEYPVGLAGVVLGVYAAARPERTARGAGRARVAAAVRGAGRTRFSARRAALYAGGFAAGLAPLAAYNVWAFGELTHSSYDDAVADQGFSGHATLGLNDGGLFGIGVPKPWIAADLLLSSRGLLVLSPVLAAAAVGVWLMHRRGQRAEARVIAAICAVFLVYDAGYWLPFGGGTPGPRFLIPVLPFLALGLAPALERLPAVTVGLAAPSVLTMLTATLTYPLIGNDNVGLWADRVADETFTNTLLRPLGLTEWASIAPTLVLLAAALLVAVRATRPLGVAADARRGALAVGAWAVVAAVGVTVFHADSLVTGNVSEGALVAAGAAAGLAVLGIAVAAARLRAPAPQRSARPQVVDHDPATDLAA